MTNKKVKSMFQGKPLDGKLLILANLLMTNYLTEVTAANFQVIYDEKRGVLVLQFIAASKLTDVAIMDIITEEIEYI